MTKEWRPICRGALGVELGFCGFTAGRDLFHRYLCLGLVTFYVSTQPLRQFLGVMSRARAAMKGRG